MNGLFNMNFMMTFLLAKDLPETKNKLLMAMSAGQSANLMAPVLLKVGAIDTITELTQENTNLINENSALQGLRADLEACRKALTDCQAALQACRDGSELKISQAQLKACQEELEARKAELDACKLELADCKGKFDACKNASSSINASLDKVRAKKNATEFASDKDLLNEIFILAGPVPSVK
jgi:predicted  nucleic acid-binding Zn-ribbon protein